MDTNAMIQQVLSIAVNGFILIYIGFAWTWDLPSASLLNRVARKLGQPLVWIGLSHSWSMFSPNPMRTNYQLTADVLLEDGTTIQWRALRFDRISKRQAFLRVREVKLYEHLASERFPFLKPAFADYLAKQVRAQGLHPIKVVLKCTDEPVPDIGTDATVVIATRTIYTHHIAMETEPRHDVPSRAS
jgi:hypothetical protein